MILAEAIFAQLSGTAGLTALVGTRIYPLKSPQGATRPLVWHKQVSGPRTRAMGNTVRGGRPRWQFVAEADTYIEAKDVAAQLVAALDNYEGLMGGASGVTVKAVQLENELDDYEPETKAYQVLLDFIIWHEEG